MTRSARDPTQWPGAGRRLRRSLAPEELAAGLARETQLNNNVHDDGGRDEPDAWRALSRMNRTLGRSWLGRCAGSVRAMARAGLCLAGAFAAAAGAQGVAGDKAVAEQLARLDARQFELPAALDAPLRQEAQELARAHLDRTRSHWERWVAEERSLLAPGQDQDVTRRLTLRAINEWMLVSIDSAGPAHDEAWLRAALAPRACYLMPSTFFGRRMALIHAAPEQDRPVLLAAERELLGRWGQKRQPPDWWPGALDTGAAQQALARLRAGLTVDAEPMSPLLAGMVFSRDRKEGEDDPWQRCGIGQWWVASQLARGQLTKPQALAALRRLHAYDALAVGAPDSVLRAEAAHSRSQDLAYPPIAVHFEVEGRTMAEVQVDVEGRVLSARVIERALRVPGVRDNPPLAFETLLDGITLRAARLRPFKPGLPGPQRVEFAWRLE